MKTFGWYKKMHDEAKDSPEYKACMEELIREEKMMRGFIMVNGDNWSAHLNVELIESVYRNEITEETVIGMFSGEAYRLTQPVMDVMERIDKARQE